MSHLRAQVRLIEAAAHDLTMLVRSDPQIVRQVLKRLLYIERNPTVGDPLLGDLIGYRKLTVGDRHWRIIWRVVTEANGDLVVEIAEVWGVGARAESAIYAEMTRRVATLPKNPQTIALGDVIESLGRTAMGLRAEEQQRREPLPEWLLSRLVYTAGFARREVESLDGEAAMELWERHITSGNVRDDEPRSPT
jgi:mRNA interferase RelE/StbE